MLKIAILMISITLCAKAEFIDDDMDGVENSFDKCPKTPLSALVDKDGCPTKTIKFTPNKNLDISLSYYHAKIDDTYTQTSKSLNLIYNYNQYAFILNGSRYDINGLGNGLDDTTVGLFYTFENKIYSQLGGGVYLPTENSQDNKTDYFFRVKFLYTKDLFDTTFSYTKTFMKDINTSNTNSYIISLGYSFLDNLYSSISYSSSDSIYANSGKIDYLSLYLEYYITDKFYISTTYSDGQSKDANDYSYSFDIGYSF